MTDSVHSIEQAATTDGLPVSPSLGPALRGAQVPIQSAPIDLRMLTICAICIVIGIAAGYVAQLLIRTIWLITNLSFFGRWSIASASPPHTPADNPLGILIIAIPVVGAVVIGFIARYGSRQVAGHGIPEAMEQVLVNQSRIPPKMTFLKPFSAAISIGTGGPFGAEGPIIATGGALGSLIGQLLATTASERKTLLAAGAAAGIAAAFGSPIAAVFLAIELLLFEYRARSIIPVALACAVATLIHVQFEGTEPFFHLGAGAIHSAGAVGLIIYVLIGSIMGLAATVLTRTVYRIEHFFEHQKIHWMWHPAIGAIAVGVIGYISPRTLGSGYFNINDLLSGRMVLATAAGLLALKFLSWTISLGSGTAGGTLAPVFTIGGALGACVAIILHRVAPNLPFDPRIAALVGMVAIFAGVSRALLTCVLFAFETTQEPAAILPCLCGCAAAYAVSALLMRQSMMTEKMHRQGVRVPADYSADFLDTVLVQEVQSRSLIRLKGDQTVAEVQQWIESGAAGSSHQGFPIVDGDGLLLGVLTRRDLLSRSTPLDRMLGQLIRRPPVLVYSDCTLREAADHMANHDIGRLPVITRHERKLVAMVTRSDVLKAHRRRLREQGEVRATISLTRQRGNPPAA